MKIITNTKRCGVLCYVQVKDFLFLSRITKNEKLMNYYLDLINNGALDDEFIKVSGHSLIEIFKKCDYIIDFSELGKKSVSADYVSRLMVSINTALTISTVEAEGIKHKTDDLRDIIAFKNGTLEYKMPLVPDGRMEVISPDKAVVFESTCVSDCFILSSLDDRAVQTIDYFDFYEKCIDDMYDKIYPEVSKEDRKYKCVDRGKSLIITVIHAKKPKKTFKERILSKMKKEV